MKGRTVTVSKETAFEIFKRRDTKKGQVKEWIAGKYRTTSKSTVFRVIEAYDYVKNHTIEEISEKYSNANSKGYFEYAMEYCNKAFKKKDIVNSSDPMDSNYNFSSDEIASINGYRDLYLQSEKNLKIARTYAEEYEIDNRKKAERIRSLENAISDILQILKDNKLVDII